MSFSSFGLPEKLLHGIYGAGYSIPTEIQQKSIPQALEGRDILGCAPTGTGKTAAFMLPILTHLMNNSEQTRPGYPRVLVLLPTRELAQQVTDFVRLYASSTQITATAIYGGVSYNNQIRDLKTGVDIVVATPGRLLDHMDQRTINLSKVEILVLDEADRMYDMGFIKDVRAIASCVSKKRQTLLFSATMPYEIRKLISELLSSPVFVEVGSPTKPTDLVAQHFFSVSPTSKMDLLVTMLRNEEIDTTLVFSRTRHGADRICKRLQREGISSSAIHSDRSQSQRQRTLDGFKRRAFQVLVATDLAARGIDVEKISCVFNFDTPPCAEDYIHRIGRTGRAEQKGIAVTFVTNDEIAHVKKIEMVTGKKFRLKEYPGFEVPKQVVESAPEKPSYLQRKAKYYKVPKFA
jgi:ATP-dependent RNA helicase RhlE